MNKKGQLTIHDIPHVAMWFLLAGVFFAVAIVVLRGVGNTSAAGNVSVAGTANYAIDKTVTAVSEIPTNWMLLIAVIVAAAVVIGVVMTSMRGHE